MLINPNPTKSSETENQPIWASGVAPAVDADATGGLTVDFSTTWSNPTGSITHSSGTIQVTTKGCYSNL